MNLRTKPCKYLRKRFPGRERSKCKVPEVATVLVYLKYTKETHVTRQEWAQSKAIKYDIREETGARLCRVFLAMGRPQSYIFHEISTI